MCAAAVVVSPHFNSTFKYFPLISFKRQIKLLQLLFIWMNIVSFMMMVMVLMIEFHCYRPVPRFLRLLFSPIAARVSFSFALARFPRRDFNSVHFA